jgi:predicted phosphodiesterase
MSVTVIGDVHGKYDQYVNMARKRDFTVQLGDLGFKYECLKNLDPERHKVVGGNHDNYEIIGDWPHYLGDYGMASLGGVDFFFYRGAYSIDRHYRTIGIDWWEEEQLKIEDFMKAREVYREAKPDVVITHDCPESIGLALLPPGAHVYQNTTSWALQELFQIHQPKMWRFAHWHRSWSMTIGRTNFRCLDELEAEEIG